MQSSEITAFTALPVSGRDERHSATLPLRLRAFTARQPNILARNDSPHIFDEAHARNSIWIDRRKSRSLYDIASWGVVRPQRWARIRRKTTNTKLIRFHLALAVDCSRIIHHLLGNQPALFGSSNRVIRICLLDYVAEVFPEADLAFLHD